MDRKREIFFFIAFTFMCLFCCEPVMAQDGFVNEEIKVGKREPVDIKFAEEILKYDISCNEVYELEKSGNSKTISIGWVKDNNGLPCILKLLVGKKTHTFRILYREEIGENFQVIDYTDSKRMKEAIKANQARQNSSTPNPVPPPADQKIDNQPAPVAEPPVKPVTTDYTTLLNQAYGAYDIANYSEALSFVEKALSIRPGDRQAS